MFPGDCLCFVGLSGGRGRGSQGVSNGVEPGRGGGARQKRGNCKWGVRVSLGLFVAFLRRSCQSSFARQRGRVKSERSEPARVGLTRFRCRVTQDSNGEGSAAPTREFVRCCIT